MRRRYWIKKLRKLTKRIIQTCHGCQRFHTTAYVAPILGRLPPDRTNRRWSFQVIGLGFAGPMIYKRKKDSLKLFNILLITCILSWAVHLELVGSRKIEEFIRAFKRFVGRRRRYTGITPRPLKQQHLRSSFLEIRIYSRLLGGKLYHLVIQPQWSPMVRGGVGWGISLNEWLVWWDSVYTKLLERLTYPSKD